MCSKFTRNPKPKTRNFKSALALAFLTFFPLGHGICLAGEAGPSWEAEWERTVKAAEQEGQVVVYKIAEDLEWHTFQKRFPKIKVVLVHGSAAQTLQRVMAERRAGKFVADVVRLGGGTSTSLYRAKALDPLPPALILPEVKDPAKWFEGRHHYNDSENQYTFVYAAFPLRLLGYNTRLVDPRTITSFGDLLDLKWKGKTTIKDPRDPGGGSPLLFLYHNPQLGPEYIKKLLTVGGLTLVRDERQQTDWLASGKFPIAITAKAEEVDEAKRQGLPVELLDAHALKEGAGLEAGGTMISLMNRAPHPNAAKVLINWFLSREGQMVIQKRGPNDPSHNSLREDIPKEDLPPGMRRQRGMRYVRLWGPEVWDRTPIRKLVSELVK
ncbi:MAG: extracellular solute-binding protein [Deltaproteobacteria bacterium]|nr:extracellular solute-binding protein [Deltaproteobacteria bacterium]